MKNLQRLLFVAAFISMTPSARLFCEDEPVQPIIIETTKPKTEQLPSEESTVAVANYDISQSINTVKNNLIKNKELLPNIGTVLGSYGLIAGAQGSHSLKKVKRNLIKVTPFISETLTQLNKGIKRNRIMMGISCVALLASFAAVKFEKINKQNNEELINELN